MVDPAEVHAMMAGQAAMQVGGRTVGQGGDLVGVVKSWNGSKGFGFITSEQISGDVFFSRNELPQEAREVRGTFLEGRSVTFEALEGQDGRFKASTVTIHPAEGQSLAGMIKSYSEQNRYGFITSSSLAEDVRFQSTDLPMMVNGSNLKGKLVTFDVQQLPDGKLRVAKMQFQTSKIAAAVNGGYNPGFGGGGGCGQFAMQQIQQQMQLSEGQLAGQVKSFSEKNGYGFIVVPGQPVDIKFGKNDLIGTERINPGTMVKFVPAVTPDGRVQARQVEMGMGGGQAPVMAMKRGPEAAFLAAGNVSARPVKAPRLDASVAAGFAGQFHSGVVKSYIPSKGFGFIQSEDVPGDIYFTKQILPMEVQMAELKGQSVNFEITCTADGKFRAQSVMVG